MTDVLLPFAGGAYWLMFAVVLFGRSMDMLSTRLATPNLVLEGNPLAKKLGWKLGWTLNIAVAFIFAFLPMAAILIATAGVLVAAHNFHAAWLMRTMGEEGYRDWFVEQLSRTRLSLVLTCLLGETCMVALVGVALLCLTEVNSWAFAIGLGIMSYAAIVLFYTSLSLWRFRRKMG